MAFDEVIIMWNSIAFSTICCSSESVCQIVCGLCAIKLKLTPTQQSRLIYILIYFLAAVLGAMILFVLPLLEINELGCDSSDILCLSSAIGYRLSFTIGMFHLVLITGNYVGGHTAVALESGCWTLKVLLLLLFSCISVYLPPFIFVLFI